MSEAGVIFTIIGLVLAFMVGAVLWSAFRAVKGAVSSVKGVAAQKRQDALFVTSFPELQPYFHPAKVLQFLSGWAARKPRTDTVVWKNPPGFGVAGVRLSPDRKSVV